MSVGQASRPVRALLAVVLVVVGVLCLGGGVLVAGRGGTPGVVLSIALVEPFGFVALLAAAFVAAPFSWYGRWLDQFVPLLARPGTALLTAAALAIASAVVVFAAA